MRLLYVVAVAIFALSFPSFGESPQAERIIKQIDAIAQILDTDQPLETYLTQDVALKIRGNSFNLEELFRAYEKQHPKKLAGTQALMKGLEDTVGRFVDGSEHVRLGEKMGLPKEAMDYLKEERARVQKELMKFIRNPEAPWVGKNNMLNRIKESTLSVNWEGENEDRLFLVDHMKGMFENIKNGEYDLNVTQGENGLHQLRRDLRKMVILQLALNYDGKLVTTNVSVPEFDYLTKDEVFTKSKYGYLPVSEPRKSPILIPYPLYLAGARQVQDIGLAKDVLEAREDWVRHALVNGGVIKQAKDEVDKKFEKRLDAEIESYIEKIPEWQTVDVEALKKNAAKMLFKSEFIPDLSASFEEQLSWSKDDCRQAVLKLLAKK